jgi:hypothetical protein
MNAIDKVLESYFRNYTINTYPFKKSGHIANFIDSNKTILGSSLRRNQSEAISVAVSEAIERKIVRSIFGSNKYFLNSYPSTCGFSCGKDSLKTSIRSRLEGFERWCFSQWIDQGCYIDQVKSLELDIFENNLTSEFDEILYFKKDFLAEDADLPFDTTFGVTVCIIKDGCFLGSRAWPKSEEDWGHCLAEAWICKLYYENNKSLTRSDSIIDKRIIYFATRLNEAIQQIPTKPHSDWAKARTLFHSEIIECQNPFYMFRTIYNNYIGWHLGDTSRFVY